MKDKEKKGIGLTFALNGLIDAFKYERNFRIHLVMAVIAILFSFIFQLSSIEWLFIIFAIAFVLVTELTNSVVERLIDYVKPEMNEHARIIKDMAAAIVLIMAITAVLIGLIIFLPKFLNLLF